MRLLILSYMILILSIQLIAQKVSNSHVQSSRPFVSDETQHTPYKTHEFNFTFKKPGLYTIEDWRALIDTTWGQGRSTEEKLQIFDICMDEIDREYAGFINSDIDWNYLMSYRDTISSGVSLDDLLVSCSISS